MHPRTGALLTIAVGLGGLALAASAQQQRLSSFRVAPPAAGQSQAMAIDWPAAGRQARSPINERGRSVNAKFLAANQAAINQISIPVLLPGDPDLAANLRIFPNGAFYTLGSTSNGMAFVLTGAGRAFPLSKAAAAGLPGGDLKSRIPPDGIVIDGGEAGINASFSRFGASYSISLECAQPQTDPRCISPGYVKGVIARLMVVTPGGPK